MSPRRPGRKLLVASLGVAAVNYAYSCSNGTTTNVDGGGTDAPMEAIVANLAPPPQDSGIDATPDVVDDVTGDAPSDVSATDAGTG